MKVRIKTFQSGCGDCIFLIIENNEERYSVMIDCGEYTEEIKNYIVDTLGCRINLLIVTHIDADHILGVEKILIQHPTMEIGKILFNCYQRDLGKRAVKLTPAQKKRLDGIKSEIKSVCFDALEQNISAKQATEGLANAILSRQQWKDVWEREYIVLDGKNEECLGKWGAIKFLAPTLKEIKSLDKEFKSLLFSELFTESDGVEYKNSESLFEILLRYAELYTTEPPVEKETATMDLEQTLINAAEESVKESSITKSNKASMAFVWELGEKKVLFLGDAKPGIVVDGLLKHYPNGPWPMRFEAVKVAHHGSHNNTTEELMRHIDSEHFFLTGGEEGERPSEAALGRILLQPLRCGVQKRTLHVNYRTTLTEHLQQDKALQNKYHFKLDFSQNEYEFTL